MDQGKALTIGKFVLAELKGMDVPVDRAEIAGSTRRGVPEPGDVDIVAEVDVAQREMVRWHYSMKPSITIECDGPLAMRFFDRRFDANVDIYFARPATKKLPGNWGSILLCRTGSKKHNKMLAATALGLGRKWELQEGITKGPQVLASETEEAMFAALQMPYIEPERRI